MQLWSNGSTYIAYLEISNDENYLKACLDFLNEYLTEEEKDIAGCAECLKAFFELESISTDDVNFRELISAFMEYYNDIE